MTVNMLGRMPANMGEFIDQLSSTKSQFGKKVIDKWVGKLGVESMKNFRAQPFTKTKLMTFRCFAEKMFTNCRAKESSDEGYVELCRQAEEFLAEIASFSQNRKVVEVHAHS